MEPGDYNVKDLKKLSKSVEYLMDNSRDLARKAVGTVNPYDPVYLRKVNSVLEKRRKGLQKLYKIMRTARLSFEQQIVVGKELKEGDMYARMSVRRIEG